MQSNTAVSQLPRIKIFLLLFAKLDLNSLEVRVEAIVGDSAMPFEVLSLTSSQGIYQIIYSVGLPKKTFVSKTFLHLLTATSNINHLNFIPEQQEEVMPCNECVKEGFLEEVTFE